MMEPWEYFRDCIRRRSDANGRIRTDYVTEAADHLSDAAAELIGWLTMQQAWPWFAARILAGTLMDEAAEWVVAGESLDGLAVRLRATWNAPVETEPGRPAWQRLAWLVVEPVPAVGSDDCVVWTAPCLTAA